MRLLDRALLAFLLIVLSPRAARAEEPLHLESVLASIDRHFPLIEAARRDQQVAEAELLSARGAFDPTVRTRMDGAPLGGYRNGRFDLLFDAPTPLWGTNLFAGYRVAFGKFADYDGKLETNQFGELRAGLSISLLRNGPTDRRRAGIARAELGVPVSATGIKQARIEAARTGSFRYWEWVAAGQRLNVAKLLLKLAEARDAATEARVRRGELARIDRIDNQRAVLGRRGGVVAAERALQAAAIELSIYLRDERGDPLLPDPSQLPAELPGPESSPPEQGSGPVERDSDQVSVALKNRPELERLRLQREQQRIERDLARNQMLPAIDLLAVASQDFGPGDPFRAPTVIEGGVSIEIPTLNRTARGRRQAAEALLARLDVQARFARDRIRAELADVLSAIATARDRVRIAHEEVELSREVEEAERTRFSLGDSNLIFVNLREQATAEASLREIDARLDYHRARAAYRAVLAVD